MNENKTKVIGVRVDVHTDTRLSRFEAETGVERVTLARNAILAALIYYDETGKISFPLRMVEPRTDQLCNCEESSPAPPSPTVA